MKRFGLKGKSVGIKVILAIIVLLLILCMGFGYCLRFTYREGNLDVKQIPAWYMPERFPPDDVENYLFNLPIQEDRNIKGYYINL